MLNRRSLSQAITLIESTRPEDRQKAENLLDSLELSKILTFRIGVSGVPGAGKSTFIDVFGSLLIEKGHKVAVLAIDPSSRLTHGSILADKTRMQRLSSSPDAFIRPTPSAGVLGGVAARTREVTLLCESAGYDIILIETVGIGQSETEIFDLTDAVLLLIPPAAGDELQGLKKGIVEIADLLLINKADGELQALCDQAYQVYAQALKLTPQRAPFWTPTLHKISALEGRGLEDVWQDLEKYRDVAQQSGSWEKRRKQQRVQWLEDEVREELWRVFKENYGEHFDKESKSPVHAARDLIRKNLHFKRS